MPRYKIVQLQNVPENAKMKAISEVNAGQPEVNKPMERNFNTLFEMQQAASEAFGAPISLVNGEFITGTVFAVMSNLSRTQSRSEVEKVKPYLDKMETIVADYADRSEPEVLPNFKNGPVENYFQGYVVTPTNAMGKAKFVAQADIDYIKGELTGFTELVDEMIENSGGMDPEDYEPGQEFSESDLKRVNLENLKEDLRSFETGISNTMLGGDSVFCGTPAMGIYGSTPALSYDLKEAEHTPEIARVMMSALPLPMVQYHGNKMADTEFSYRNNLRKNGYSAETERNTKIEFLKRAAKLRPLTSQCIAVAEDEEFFSLGEQPDVKVYVNGTDDISGDRGRVTSMDANLEMYEKGIKNGWPLSDLETLGRLEFLSRRTEVWEKKTGNGKSLSNEDKEKLKGFRDLVNEIKTTPINSYEDRNKLLERADGLIKGFGTELTNFHSSVIATTLEKISESLQRELSLEEKKEIGNLGPIKAEIDKIEIKTCTKEDLEVLKEKTKNSLEYEATTLQSKSAKKVNDSSRQFISRSEALNAYKSILEKDDSFFHFDSKQFKAIKSGLKKVQDGTATGAEREKLKNNVKQWLTDPKYDRINKHGRNNFDNTRFNDMFALANELDPKWAHENFDRMKISGLHGKNAEETKFYDIRDFLKYKHTQLVDRDCIENPGSQKEQDWYKSSYSPSEEAMIREVENAWKSPQFTDKIRFDAEASNIMKINGMGFSKEITLYFSKLNMVDTIFTNEDGTINKEAFQEERKAAVKSVEDYIKNPENRGNEKFEKAMALYGILEPVKASTMIKDMKAKNLDNSKIQKLNLAALEKKAGLDIGGRKEFNTKRAAAKQNEKVKSGSEKTL